MDSDNSEIRDRKPRKLIIGIGNDYRGDDGVGVFVAGRLREMGLPDIETREARGEGTELMTIWQGVETVIVVDAVYSKSEPGRVFRFEIGKDELQSAIFRGHSSHAFGLAEAINLASNLGSLPNKLIIYGIEGKSFETGEGLSVEIKKAAELVISKIVEEVNRDGAH